MRAEPPVIPVVDDETVIFTSLRRLLIEEGGHILPADSGAMLSRQNFSPIFGLRQSGSHKDAGMFRPPMSDR